jgi:hypothetical protein
VSSRKVKLSSYARQDIKDILTLGISIKKGVSFGRFGAFGKRLGFAGVCGLVEEPGRGLICPINKRSIFGDLYN